MVGDPMQSYGVEKGMDCDFSETRMLNIVTGRYGMITPVLYNHERRETDHTA